MIIRQALPATHNISQTPAAARNDDRLVPAAHVKFLLRELAVALHATKAVGWKGGIAPKKG